MVAVPWSVWLEHRASLCVWLHGVWCVVVAPARRHCPGFASAVVPVKIGRHNGDNRNMPILTGYSA